MRIFGSCSAVPHKPGSLVWFRRAGPHGSADGRASCLTVDPRRIRARDFIASTRLWRESAIPQRRDDRPRHRMRFLGRGRLAAARMAPRAEARGKRRHVRSGQAQTLRADVSCASNRRGRVRGRRAPCSTVRSRSAGPPGLAGPRQLDTRGPSRQATLPLFAATAVSHWQFTLAR